MAESVQSNQSGNVAPSHAPVPRKKVTVSLTASQAETLRSLWQEHSAALHAMLTGWCGDAQSASDILQELFRRLAQSPAAMTRVKNARAFLAVSARRIAVDFARRSKTRSDYQTAAGAEAPTVENPGPTDEKLRAVISAALDGLPAEQRSVFEHKILNGRTLEEISRLEGVSLNTVSSRLRYALDKIRGQLRPYYDDLNRKDFNIMKNDPSNKESFASERIITPLAPKRVPSVAPGLEGLAAMAPDACEAAPEIVASEAEFVAAAGEAPIAEMSDPEIAFCGVGGNAWEQSLPDSVELPVIDGENISADESAELFVTGEIPEMISCELLPPDGEIPREWLDQPENFFVTLFNSDFDLGADGSVGDEIVDGEGVPFDLESGFEICVLPVPEELSAGIDPNELLARYEEFLHQDPAWLPGLAENQGDWFHEQVTTASAYFEKLEFGTPGEASAFDQWFASNFAAANTTGEESAYYDGEQPGYADDSWSFDPKDLLVRYEDFLRENSDWGALDPDTMEIQVVTPSSYFGELEFGTPSMANAFDNWYVNVYSQGGNGIGPVDGSGLVLDGSGDFPGEVVLTGGEIVNEGRPDGSGLSSGTGLVLSGGGSFTGGTIISGGNVYSEDKAFSLETTGTITDGRNGATGIPAEWMRGGASGGEVLTLNGGVLISGAGVGNLSVDGDAASGAATMLKGVVAVPGAGIGNLSVDGVPSLEGSTVVTGGELLLGDGVTVATTDGNTLTLSDGSTVVLQGGQVVTGETVYAYNPEVGVDPIALAVSGELPTDISIADASGAELVPSLTTASAGLAPTPGAALIVEFSVLSPSETVEPVAGSPVTGVQPPSRDTVDLPNVFSAAANFDGVETASISTATTETLRDLPPQDAASGQGLPVTTLSSHSVDAPTAAAGAVAAGTVVHGGAAAPAVRRPLPKI